MFAHLTLFQGTFRVDYPVPQAVANEDDLITNSARSVKARHYTEKVINKQNNHVVSPTQPQQNSKICRFFFWLLFSFMT